MNWKKIVCVKKETEQLKCNGDDSFRRFDQFREISFEVIIFIIFNWREK